jgi:hypothetical protein
LLLFFFAINKTFARAWKKPIGFLPSKWKAILKREEFFAVLSEYFFERPILLKKKHPELYEMLEEVFDQDLVGMHQGVLKGK